jgi:pSer/pThr/pTyr-binding forkhead associated (FHA) protein
VITDLESTNGTFVDGKRVADPTPLSDGDTIKVGSVTLKFREWTEKASRTRRIKGGER